MNVKVFAENLIWRLRRLLNYLFVLLKIFLLVNTVSNAKLDCMVAVTNPNAYLTYLTLLQRKGAIFWTHFSQITETPSFLDHFWDPFFVFFNTPNLILIPQIFSYLYTKLILIPILPIFRCIIYSKFFLRVSPTPF